MENKLGLLVPYVAMILGLYIFHSGWLAFIIYHVLILIVMYFTKTLNQWKNLFKGWNTKIAILATIFGLVGGIILYLLAPMAGIRETITTNLSLIGLSGIPWLLFIIYHLAINSWFEESYWRGTFGSKKKGLVFTDVIFAGYHMLVLALFLKWHWIALSFVILTIAAWFWRQLVTKYEGLLLPTISHIAADASIMIVVYLLSI
ncbi:hypothetical protein K8R33_04755 [archaeon]|nr:hypothetical protein [archaeon]